MLGQRSKCAATGNMLGPTSVRGSLARRRRSRRRAVKSQGVMTRSRISNWLAGNPSDYMHQGSELQPYPPCQLVVDEYLFLEADSNYTSRYESFVCVLADWPTGEFAKDFLAAL